MVLVFYHFSYVANDNSEKKKRKKQYSRGIASFTDQQTTFTHAQGAIFRSRDFNLYVEYLKNWSRDPTFLAEKYSTAKAECMSEISDSERFC